MNSTWTLKQDLENEKQLHWKNKKSDLQSSKLRLGRSMIDILHQKSLNHKNNIQMTNSSFIYTMYWNKRSPKLFKWKTSVIWYQSSKKGKKKVKLKSPELISTDCQCTDTGHYCLLADRCRNLVDSCKGWLFNRRLSINNSHKVQKRNGTSTGCCRGRMHASIARFLHMSRQS